MVLRDEQVSRLADIALSERDPLTAASWAHRWDMSQLSARWFLRELVDDGLVELRPCGRYVLTARGLKVLREVGPRPRKDDVALTEEG